MCSLHNAPPFQCIAPPFSVDWPLRRADRALRRHLPILLSPSLTPFRWSELSPQQRNSLLAAGLSWFFSGFDVMLYSALLPQLLGRRRRLERELSSASAVQPPQGAHIERLVEELTATESAISDMKATNA